MNNFRQDAIELLMLLSHQINSYKSSKTNRASLQIACVQTKDAFKRESVIVFHHAMRGSLPKTLKQTCLQK